MQDIENFTSLQSMHKLLLRFPAINPSKIYYDSKIVSKIEPTIDLRPQFAEYA